MTISPIPIVPLSPVDEATRRQFLGLVAGAGLLAACGTDPGSGAGDARRRVEHDLGSTEVIGTPDRVVTVGTGLDLDLLLGLGVVPAAVGGFGEVRLDRWQTERLEELGGDPDTLTWADAVEVEPLLAAQPDLVVADASYVEAIYGTLTRAVPTLTYAGSEPEWRDDLDRLATLLDRRDAAEDLRTAWDDTLAAAKRDVDLSRLSLAIVSAGADPGSLLVFGQEDLQGAVLGELGATLVLEEFIENLSPERADVLAEADVVVVLDYGSPGDALSAAPVQALPAVREGRVARIDHDGSRALYQTNPLSLPAAVDAAEAVVAARG